MNKTIETNKEYFEVEMWEEFRPAKPITHRIMVRVTDEYGKIAEDYVFSPAWWWLAHRLAIKMAKGLVASRNGGNRKHYRLWREVR